jgi:hypothetical protein
MVAQFGREAALPGHNFNDATRDRRFLSRLAVPLSFRRRRDAEANFAASRLVWPAVLA